MSKTLADKIRDNIKRGELTMKPRWYFVLRTALITFGIIMLAITAAFVVSLAVFLMRRSGIWFTPLFGLRGIGLFLIYAPWALVLISIILIVILEILTRKFTFYYRKPVFYTLGGIMSIVFFGSLLLANYGFHERINGRGSGSGYLSNRIYQGLGMQDPEKIRRGEVVQMTSTGFVLEELDGSKIAVSTSTNTIQRKRNVGIGSKVVVIGEQIGESIIAEQILNLNNNRMPRRER